MFKEIYYKSSVNVIYTNNFFEWYNQVNDFTSNYSYRRKYQGIADLKKRKEKVFTFINFLSY